MDADGNAAPNLRSPVVQLGGKVVVVTGGGNGIGAALREAVSDRTGRIPEDMEALLLKLERRSGSTAQAAISKGWISPDK